MVDMVVPTTVVVVLAPLRLGWSILGDSASLTVNLREHGHCPVYFIHGGTTYEEGYKLCEYET